MSGRKKQKRIDEARAMANIIEAKDENAKEKLRGFFDSDKANAPPLILPLEKGETANSTKIILELGCGSGDYTINLAKKYPTTKFVGVDIQGERLWLGATQANKEKLDNVIFLRTQIENLADFVPPRSVDEIWLTFPDPFPTKKKIKKRLTSERFLKIYSLILKSSGILHLKTDNKNLFDYSADSIANFGGQILVCGQVENLIQKNPDLVINTYFETKHRALGDAIYYLQATLPCQPK
ncbi:MAG: tRNA (guanosine(46)-N7)-methyltransferase TrmB [bacterium]|nr:tRNA (guanosine(46)-N7)-methyltransferase TrmB [bacterium]